MKTKLITLATALAFTVVMGKFFAKPLVAQVRAALVQDIDQPARAPFQVTVPININNFNYTPVAIPSGKRLVIDNISMSGAAQTSGPDVQPIIVLNSSVAGNPTCQYYIGPTQSTTVPGQYYENKQVTIYSDSLSLGPAYSGYTPSFLAFNVVISGHLITP